jgi:hypothetical protein
VLSNKVSNDYGKASSKRLRRSDIPDGQIAFSRRNDDFVEISTGMHDLGRSEVGRKFNSDDEFWTALSVKLPLALRTMKRTLGV